jgi:hypothetical protein
MNRSAICLVAIIAFGAAAFGGQNDAAASDYRRSGLIGGMSAAEVMGVPYGYGYGYYPGYAASAQYAPLDGPPPGCVIRRQRMWDGYGWRWRKLRICH